MTTWTGRTTPTTSYTGRTTPTTSYSARTPVQGDIGYGLNELFSIMTDENNSRITFHTGTFIAQDTQYNTRIIPA